MAKASSVANTSTSRRSGAGGWIGTEVTGEDGRPISADVFLRALTEGITETGRDGKPSEQVVLGKQGKGGGVRPSRWPDTLAKRKTHASIGLQVPTDDGPFGGGQSSRIVNWTGLWALVLDDVHEKVAPPTSALAGVSVEPTAIVETKPGSQQWWYVFECPVRERFLAEQLIDGVVKAGLSDPGMSNVIRWARLPGSQPPSKEHAARLVLWEPERLFDPLGLAAALGLEMTSWEHWNGSGGDFDGDALGERVDDPVAVWMAEHGVIEKEGSRGWLEIECPCADEHTKHETREDRRAYYLPMHEHGGGVFKCFHGHGGPDGRGHPPTQADFSRYLADMGAPEDLADNVGSIRPRDIDGLASLIADKVAALGVGTAAGGGDDAGGTVAEYAGNKEPKPMDLQPDSELLDWVYVRTKDVYTHRRTGVTLKPRAFNVSLTNILGPFFPEDEKDGKKDKDEGEKKGTGKGKGKRPLNPEDVFMMNEGDVVDAVTYRPDQSRDHLFREGGEVLLNSFLFAPMPKAVEDDAVADLLEGHIRDLFPDDWWTIVQWMAHNVQHPGVKIAWTPLLVGRQGDGKTTLGEMLRAALGGVVHVGTVSSEALHSNYTTSLVGKAVVTLEEVRMLNDKGRYDKASIVEKMKPFQTNTWVEAVGKGSDGRQVRNVTNYMAMTNWPDALELEKDDRRWAVFETRYKYATQEELPRQHRGHWDAIYAVIGDGAPVEAHGAVRGWLMSIDLSGFDPKADAPWTQAKAAMIAAAVPGIESDIEDALLDDVAGVWPDLLSTSLLTERIEATTGQRPQTRTISAALDRKGFKPADIRPLVSGKRHRLYCRGEVSSKSAHMAFIERMQERAVDRSNVHDIMAGKRGASTTEM